MCSFAARPGVGQCRRIPLIVFGSNARDYFASSSRRSLSQRRLSKCTGYRTIDWCAGTVTYRSIACIPRTLLWCIPLVHARAELSLGLKTCWVSSATSMTAYARSNAMEQRFIEYNTQHLTRSWLLVPRAYGCRVAASHRILAAAARGNWTNCGWSYLR